MIAGNTPSLEHAAKMHSNTEGLALSIYTLKYSRLVPKFRVLLLMSSSLL